MMGGSSHMQSVRAAARREAGSGTRASSPHIKREYHSLRPKNELRGRPPDLRRRVVSLDDLDDSEADGATVGARTNTSSSRTNTTTTTVNRHANANANANVGDGNHNEVDTLLPTITNKLCKMSRVQHKIIEQTKPKELVVDPREQRRSLRVQLFSHSDSDDSSDGEDDGGDNKDGRNGGGDGHHHLPSISSHAKTPRDRNGGANNRRSKRGKLKSASQKKNKKHLAQNNGPRQHLQLPMPRARVTV